MCDLNSAVQVPSSIWDRSGSILKRGTNAGLVRPRRALVRKASAGSYAQRARGFTAIYVAMRCPAGGQPTVSLVGGCGVVSIPEWGVGGMACFSWSRALA